MRIGPTLMVEVKTVNGQNARVSGRPAFSRAAMVLSKVGAALFAAMAAISARPWAMPALKAGTNSSGLTLSKAGTPPNGPFHGASNGLAPAAAPLAAVLVAASAMAGERTAALAAARKERRFKGRLQGSILRGTLDRPGESVT